MTINLWRTTGLIFFGLWLVAILSGCKKHDKISKYDNVNVKIYMKYDPIFFGKDVEISFLNEEEQAVCFLRDDIDPTLPNVKLFQKNIELMPSKQSNREVIKFKGVNISGGVEVVPHGKRSFFINISEYNLQKGPFLMSLSLKVVNCSEFFSGKLPIWHPINGRLQGSIE